MEIILLEDVPKLGDMGEVLNVKPGYARNYLIPQKLAQRASKANKAQFEHQQRMVAARRARLRGEALETHKTLDQISVILPRKAGESDKLYGSVTKRDITAALHDHGHDIDTKKVVLDNPLRELGIYAVRVKLHADVVSTIRVWIVTT